MTSRTDWLVEGDLFAVGAALMALEVVEARAAAWARSPYVSREDVESLDEEFRLIESGMPVCERRGVGRADARVLWACLESWCAKPYVSRRELAVIRFEVRDKRSLLLRARSLLQGERAKVIPLTRNLTKKTG
jgi:hypothetical protein